MTSKCLKNKILSVALCFLLGGTLSDLNAIPNAVGGQRQANRQNVAPAPNTVNERIIKGRKASAKRDYLKQGGATAQSMSQTNTDAALANLYRSNALNSERDSAAEETLSEQRKRLYAREREVSQSKMKNVSSSLAEGRYGSGGSWEGLVRAKNNSLNASFDAYHSVLSSLNMHQDVASLLRDTNGLKVSAKGNPKNYFEDKIDPATGKEYTSSKKEELAKSASYATGTVFEHIAQTNNIEMCKAAVNSLRGRDADKIESEIKGAKVKTSEFPRYDKVAHLFENGMLKSVTADQVLAMHDKLMSELRNIDPNSVRGRELTEHLDILASMYTQTIYEKVANLNEYKPGQGAGLDTLNHDNVLIDLNEFEKGVRAEQEHYSNMLEHSDTHTTAKTNDIYTSLFLNTGVEYSILNDKDRSNDSKHDASMRMLNELSRNATFEQFHHFLLAYTHDDQMSHIDKMHKVETEFKYKDASGKDKKITLGHIAEYFRYKENPQAYKEMNPDHAKMLPSDVILHLQNLEKNNPQTVKDMQELYKSEAIKDLGDRGSWRLTIPEEDYTSRLNSHEEERAALANREVGRQNNKNKATEEK